VSLLLNAILNIIIREPQRFSVKLHTQPVNWRWIKSIMHQYSLFYHF